MRGPIFCELNDRAEDGRLCRRVVFHSHHVNGTEAGSVGVFTTFDRFLRGRSLWSVHFIGGSQISCRESYWNSCPDGFAGDFCARFEFHFHWEPGVIPPSGHINPRFNFRDFYGYSDTIRDL